MLNTEIVVAKEHEIGKSAEILQSMYQLRHETFHGRLQWEVVSNDGLEIDLFDMNDPYYLLALENETQVKGCWRFLPTTEAYMLSDTFPVLLRGEAAPRSAEIWEISRFAVCNKSPKRTARGMMSYLTLEMLRAGLEFGKKNGIESYVFVTTVAIERLLKQIGINVRRFGDQQSVTIGNVDSVALWLDIDDDLENALYPSRRV